ETRTAGESRVACGIFGPTLDRTRMRKRQGANHLAEEADGSPTGVDQHDVERRTDGGENDSRETRSRADVDDRADVGEEGHDGESVDDVLLDDPLAASLPSEVDPLVPLLEERHEASQ